MLLIQHVCSFHCEKGSLSALELSAYKSAALQTEVVIHELSAYNCAALLVSSEELPAYREELYSFHCAALLHGSIPRHARRGHASFSFSLCSFALPTLGSKQPRQENARRELLSLPWISLTLSGQKLCRNQVFKQELYQQQVQKQFWKQVFQQHLSAQQQQHQH